MRWDRYGAVTAVGFPILVVTLSMLARTELIIGDRVRDAVEARARAMGADIEVLSIGPRGLRSLELERVSARIPRGQFAVEVDVGSITVTPTWSSIFTGEIEVEEIVVDRGIVAFVPWEQTARPTAKKSARSGTKKGPPKQSNPIEVSVDELQVIALNDSYRSRPLHLSHAEFVWRRGEPATRLAGYGTLPDGVAFSIAERDGAYWMRPQQRTRVDEWVAPRAGGVQWPVSLVVRDIKLCPSCDQVIAFEDVEIAVPAWREDVRITAPYADVTRAGSTIGLGAPEMALVDAKTRDFAVRVTESTFYYGLSTGHLDGKLELAAADGGTLGADWSWNARDFVVAFDARAFPLQSIWHLSPIAGRLRPGKITGTAGVEWDMKLRTLGLGTDLRVDKMAVVAPVTDEAIDVARGRLELDAFVDTRGGAISIPRLALTVGDSLPLITSAHLVTAGDGISFEAKTELVEQDVATLLEQLPPQWTQATDGAELSGRFGFRLSAAGHSAFAEGLVLDGEVLGDVQVARDGRADVRGIGRAGKPPGWRFGEWTSLQAIGSQTYEIVLAAEDAQFRNHDGFDWKGLHRAMIHNIKVKRAERGGSTISQQVAKNLFLDGQRTAARKLQEAYLTWRMESVLPKTRILELYLNLAEWTPTGGRGITAAAQHHFGAKPRDLAPVEVALLAAILPSPRWYGGLLDKGFLPRSRMQKSERVLRNLKFLDKLSTPAYREAAIALKKGVVGRKRYEVCADERDKPTDGLARCP